ncbi:MAG TPA: hypothetical protein VND19_00305, partial [Acetobacteraceae bacterium]|nr:hypothetical protein [Acetobacteraceae bacterium]
AKPRADYGELRFVPILSAVTMADFRYSASRPSIMLHLRAPGFCPYYQETEKQAGKTRGAGASGMPPGY